MTSLNHVKIDELQKTLEAIKKDPKNAKRVNRVEGEWVLDRAEGPQFVAEIQTEKGKHRLEADQPTFQGGGGSVPGPMHYCLYGLAACYTATFVTLAAMEGVRLKKVRVVAENYMDFSKTFGLSDNPIIEQVKFKLLVSSEGDKERLLELGRLAEERCPAVYCMKNPIKMIAELIVE